MTSQDRVLRYLGHDGLFHYYTGTDNAGTPLFSPVKGEAHVFPSAQHATRSAWVCESFDYEVESLTPELA